MNLKELEGFRILIKGVKSFDELDTFTADYEELPKLLELCKDSVLQEIDKNIKETKKSKDNKEIEELEKKEDDLQKQLKNTRKKLKHLKNK